MLSVREVVTVGIVAMFGNGLSGRADELVFLSFGKDGSTCSGSFGAQVRVRA